MISVIVPVYNVSAYLEQCIQSICGQTYSELEIILVDDGSTDDSPEICEKYRKRDRRIRVIHQSNRGAVSARQAGLEASSGEFVSLVDGDDWIEPDMYLHMHQKMTETQADIVMCGRYEDTGTVRRAVLPSLAEGMYNRDGLRKEVFPRMISQEGFFDWGVFPTLWDKLFRREPFIKFHRRVDSRITIGDDAACVYPVMLSAGCVYVLHECLYHYRQSASSMIKRREDRAVERRRFQILNQTVLRELKQQKTVYDLTEQWKKYMLFVTIPRADTLYRGYESLDYLFPFPGVKKGFSIVLYGAGTYGQRLYSYLQSSGFYRVVLWVDRSYAQICGEGLPVKSPEWLAELTGYDAIVVANMFGRSRKALYEELIAKYPKEKVHVMDEMLVFSKETEEALGLTLET